MLESLRSYWTRLKRGKPGHRFCALHLHRKQARQNQSSFRRNVPVVIGILLVLGGLAIGWLPGPGGFIGFIGLGMLATRFRFLARALDWSELRLLALWRFAWTRRSAPGRALVLAAALVFAAGVVYAASRLLWS